MLTRPASAEPPGQLGVVLVLEGALRHVQLQGGMLITRSEATSSVITLNEVKLAGPKLVEIATSAASLGQMKTRPMRGRLCKPMTFQEHLEPSWHQSVRHQCDPLSADLQQVAVRRRQRLIEKLINLFWLHPGGAKGFTDIVENEKIVGGPREPYTNPGELRHKNTILDSWIGWPCSPSAGCERGDA
jgi:hypothetical protein